MGAVLGICSAAQLACCCGTSACSLCCSACPSCRTSTSSRVMYALILACVMVVSCVLLSPGLQDALQSVPFCRNSTIYNYHVDCSQIAGYMSVYRLCFITGLFFTLMALITMGVRSSNDFRAGIHNGFWGLKYLLIIGGTVGAFFIPAGHLTWCMYFAMIGGFLYIIIQLVLLINFSHNWAQRWLENAESAGDDSSRIWYIALAFFSLAHYLLSIMGIVLLYVYYTHSESCGLSKFFISFNMVACVLISILSVLPAVQERTSQSGLLQASLICLYVVYLTWGSVSNYPDANCKPTFLSTYQPSNSTSSTIQSGLKPSEDSSEHFGYHLVISLVIWMLFLLYSTLSLSSDSQQAKLTGSSKLLVKKNSTDYAQDDVTNTEAGGQRVWDNETETTAYSWSLSHVVFLLATCYLLMTLTNWYSPSSDLRTLTNNFASMWMKIIASWTCLAMYAWILVAPLILTNRDFS